MGSETVTFVLHGEPLDELGRLDPDRDWREFVTGERAWILQTYLRLRADGAAVRLADELPADGIAVFSSKQRRTLVRGKRRATQAVLVGVRQDVGEALVADLEVVQNQTQADAKRRFHIPHWPQPGMLGRDAARGSRIETIAYKGFLGNLHPAFREATWLDFLRGHGIRWLVDAAPYTDDFGDAATLAWNDFREVDLVLAVRAPDAKLHPRKPATKLYNAWLAGVPALLGPEVAYRELRRSALDYLEVADVGAAQAAILKLLSSPSLHADMVSNGHVRAAEFQATALVRRWHDLLFSVVPSLATRADVSRWRGRSLRRKELSRRGLRALGVWK
jgi:hypothetical protein